MYLLCFSGSVTIAHEGVHLPLPEDQLKEVAAKAKDFALCHGNCLKLFLFLFAQSHYNDKSCVSENLWGQINFEISCKNKSLSHDSLCKKVLIFSFNIKGMNNSDTLLILGRASQQIVLLISTSSNCCCFFFLCKYEEWIVTLALIWTRPGSFHLHYNSSFYYLFCRHFDENQRGTKLLRDIKLCPIYLIPKSFAS